MVNFLLFPLQCRINVLSSLCGVFDFPQNGLFLQNSPGAQTILFWWALYVLFMVITLTSLISDEISCAYFVLFMSLILLLVFPPFFQLPVFSFERHSSYITLKTKGETLLHVSWVTLQNIQSYQAIFWAACVCLSPSLNEQQPFMLLMSRTHLGSWKQYVALRRVY